MRKRGKNGFLVLLAGLALCSGWLPVKAAWSDLDAPDWPPDSDAGRLERQRIAAVNEGDLVFLHDQPGQAVHQHSSRILISRQSLADGWVSMEQCHEGLDQVAEAQIVFNTGRVRALELLDFQHMDAAFVELNTIQLRGIGKASRVCIRLETRALHPLGRGVFELRNGPFMRRFLDGYYPLQLSLQIKYPAEFELLDFAPAVQPGFMVRSISGQVDVEALFEGRLWTRFRFLAE